MDPAEYANLESVERAHWYYAGKRELVGWWLDRVGPPASGQTLLDCGAGTGLFALSLQDRCRVLVLDDHEESLRLLRRRFRPEQVLAVSGDEVPLPDQSLDYATALDVLEHVPDDRRVVRSLHRVLKPGGVAIVTVPASMKLWSEWDEVLHHYRRYDRAQLRALFPSADWDLVYLNYTNSLAFPAVWLIRRLRRWQRRAQPGGPGRWEDRVPPRWINALLKTWFVCLGRTRIRIPFGVSLLLIARRRARAIAA